MPNYTQDAVFMPGKLHGCEDELYIVYLNPNGNDELGVFEIEILEASAVLELWNEVETENEFLDLLPDKFHGKWQYANRGTDEYDEILSQYEEADFIVGRDGSLEDEVAFIIEWAKRCCKKASDGSEVV